MIKIKMLGYFISPIYNIIQREEIPEKKDVELNEKTVSKNMPGACVVYLVSISEPVPWRGQGLDAAM